MIRKRMAVCLLMVLFLSVSRWGGTAALAAEGETTIDFQQLKAELGGGRYAPVLYSSSLSLDGDFSDWANLTGIQLPTNSEQVMMDNWAGSEDLSADVRFAYDDNRLYIGIKVIDDVHNAVSGSGLWHGDSVQMAFGQDGSYGPEYGFSDAGGTPAVWRYSDGTAVLGPDEVELATSRNGNETVYEAAIPWQAIFASKPVDSLRFSLLVNDNDGSGRKGWIEWTSAIGSSKSGSNLATLGLEPQNSAWSAWLAGANTVQSGDEGALTLFIPNYSDSALELQLNIPGLELSNESVSIPANQVWRKSFSLAFDEPGEQTVIASISEPESGASRTETFTVQVLEDADGLIQRLDQLEAKMPALQQLLDECTNQGISTDYETVNYTVLSNFIGYGRDDVAHSELSRAAYVVDELENLYDQAKTDLQAYLDGDKQPQFVPRYETQHTTIQGSSFIGDQSQRPIFFTGYGHFNQVREDVPKFTGYGTNAIQIEIGPNSVLKPVDSLPGWSASPGTANAQFNIVSDMSHSGTNSIEIINPSAYASNIFGTMVQEVAVQPDTTYTFSAWVKGDQAGKAYFTTIPDWSERHSLPQGTYDWQKVAFAVTTGANQTTLPLRLVSEDLTAHLWIDDIHLSQNKAWEMSSGSANAEFQVDTTVSHSGSQSLRISNPSAYAPNIFGTMSQAVAVDPNSDYHISAWIKGDATSHTYFTAMDNWGERQHIPNGTYDWQQFEFDTTTAANQTKLTLRLVSEGISNQLWVDDVSVMKQGDAANLLKNEGFETDFSNQVDNFGFEETSNAPDGEDYVISTTKIHNDIQQVLDNAANHNIAVNLLLSPHYFPSWALEKWPELKSKNSNFLKYNIDAPKAKELIEAYLRAIIPLIKDYPALNSVTLSNEPTYIDSRGDVNTENLWHQYLQTVYNDIDALNEVYSTNYASIDEVPVPDPDQLDPSPNTYDWTTFNNQRFADWHQWMADIIHSMAPNLPVQAKIMSGALRERDPLVSWGVDPEQFADLSEINGDDNYNYLDQGPDGFMQYLKFYDLQHSMKDAPIFNSEDHVIRDRDTNYDPFQALLVRSDLWQGAIHGRSGSTIWVWERTYNETSDTYGSIMTRPDAVTEVGRTNLDLNRLSEQVTAFQEAPAHVAILYSTPSGIYSANYADAVDRAYKALSYQGQKVAFISEKQIQDGALDAYELLVVPEATNVLASTLEGIRQYATTPAHDGHVVIIGNDSLQRDEHNQPLDASARSAAIDHSEVVAGDVSESALNAVMANQLDELDLNRVMLLDAVSGQPVQHVEWRSASYNGRLLINVTNYTQEEKQVDIQVDGQTVGSMEELISDRQTSAGTVVLEGLTPKLFSVIPSVAMMQNIVNHCLAAGELNAVLANQLSYRLQIIHIMEQQGDQAEAAAYVQDLLNTINDASVQQQQLLSKAAADALNQAGEALTAYWDSL
ncbi:sugar-binding protein [Paenibacillus sp. HB172176]|uniref:sugar-binding protein n=1 Tax=Paenibacillus sp. HB172176 TaxID=2493690 RepID=UPI00143886C0|nr:sugar-binding protein [Paenibacillus sp. HB172176]